MPTLVPNPAPSPDRQSPYFDFAELANCLFSIVPGNHVTAQIQASDASFNMRDKPFDVTYHKPPPLQNLDCSMNQDKRTSLQP